MGHNYMIDVPEIIFRPAGDLSRRFGATQRLMRLLRRSPGGWGRDADLRIREGRQGPNGPWRELPRVNPILDLGGECVEGALRLSTNGGG
jgi:hypothetical protein